MKTAIVLSGEGARGSYQAGVLKSLSDVQADLVVGISSGSVNAVGYAYRGAQWVCDQWREVDSIKKIFEFSPKHLVLGTGVFSSKPAQKIIRDAVLGGETQNRLPCTVANIDVRTGELFRVSNLGTLDGQFINAATCAMSIPGVVHSDTPFYDAGARELAPLKYAIDQGCERIFVILGRPLTPPSFPENKGLFTLFGKPLFRFATYGFRFIDLLLYEILLRDLALCKERNSQLGYRPIDLHVLGPSRFMYDALDFKQCREGLNLALSGDIQELKI